jgi:hypothetical protein
MSQENADAVRGLYEAFARGDHAMGEQRLHGTSRQGGVQTDALVYDVFTLEDGLIVRHALFSDRAPAVEALETAG